MLRVALPHPDCGEISDGGKAAGEAEAAALCDAEPNCLIVGMNGDGRWVVRDRLGLKAGIFSSFESAIHFAKMEAEAAHSGVILSEAGLELGLDL